MRDIRVGAWRDWVCCFLQGILSAGHGPPRGCGASAAGSGQTWVSQL